MKEIKEEMEMLKWEERVPYAYWKGDPRVYRQRYLLMHCNLTLQNDWNARLYTVVSCNISFPIFNHANYKYIPTFSLQDWQQETQRGFDQSNLAKQCTHRWFLTETMMHSIQQVLFLILDSLLPC